MRRVAAATSTELFELKPVRRGLFVLRRYVIPLFALRALQNYVISRHFLIRPLSFVLGPSPNDEAPRTND